AQAVRDARTDQVSEVRKHLANQTYMAPEGIVSIDPDNNHTWKKVRVGRIREDGQFNIVWDSEKPIPPVPYPVYRSKDQWHKFLEDLYNGWGNRWANPGPDA
ncbi:MAG: transporter substrate-binding protein, partial [Planctomycetota bacterium]|nr:transporter substrate-binding protein [Planctomycetota bacterium]